MTVTRFDGPQIVMFLSFSYFLYFISIFVEMDHEESDALLATSEIRGHKTNETNLPSSFIFGSIKPNVRFTA